MVAVVTQVDELDPKRVEPPVRGRDQAAQHRNRGADDRGGPERARRRAGPGRTRCPPTPSTINDAEGAPRVYDNYWNIEELVDYLVEVLPRSAQVQMARLAQSARVQEKLARKMTAAAVGGRRSIGAVPIPVADIVPITALQIGLVTGIAYLSGREMSKSSAREFLVALGANVGAAFALREGARASAKFVFPGAGSAVSAGVAFAGTWATGRSGDRLFHREAADRGGPGAVPAEEEGEGGKGGELRSGRLQFAARPSSLPNPLCQPINARRGIASRISGILSSPIEGLRTPDRLPISREKMYKG